MNIREWSSEWGVVRVSTDGCGRGSVCLITADRKRYVAADVDLLHNLANEMGYYPKHFHKEGDFLIMSGGV